MQKWERDNRINAIAANVSAPFRWQSAKDWCYCQGTTAFRWRDENGREFTACSVLHARRIQPEGTLILIAADRAQSLGGTETGI